MTPALRRRLAVMLAGTAAMLVALTVVQRVRQDHAAGAARAYLLGALAGVATLVVLWRTFTYFTTRGRRLR